MWYLGCEPQADGDDGTHEDSNESCPRENMNSIEQDAAIRDLQFAQQRLRYHLGNCNRISAALEKRIALLEARVKR
jgi:hypothetical protein|tara:strand:- start:12792 stop:13019 length:228 start_codon:yes stop_codon:yes gene_type:complete